MKFWRALHQALGLDGLTVRSVDDAKPMADALLMLKQKLWDQVTAVRNEPMSDASMAGLHPVVRSIIEMDESIWGAPFKAQRVHAKAKRENVHRAC